MIRRVKSELIGKLSPTGAPTSLLRSAAATAATTTTAVSTDRSRGVLHCHRPLRLCAPESATGKLTPFVETAGSQLGQQRVRVMLGWHLDGIGFHVRRPRARMYDRRRLLSKRDSMSHYDLSDLLHDKKAP